MGQPVDTNYLTSLLAVTRDVWQPELTDALYYENALLNEIKDKSKVNYIKNGPNLQVPVMVSGNTNVSAFENFDTIPSATQKGFVDAVYQKKRYGVTVPVSDQEIEENGGDAKIVDIVTARIKQATMSTYEEISDDLYLDGTGTSSKVVTGLDAMVSETPASGSYAGLDPATITAWQNKFLGTATLATMIDDMDKVYYELINGKAKPKIIVSDALGSKEYAAASRDASGANISYLNASKADAGFGELAYHGMPLLLDTHAPQASPSLPIFWMLNSDKLGFFFEMGDFKTAGRTAGQFADTLQMAIICQLMTNDRKSHGKVTFDS